VPPTITLWNQWSTILSRIKNYLFDRSQTIAMDGRPAERVHGAQG